jgi:hypothetical protein
MEEVIKFLGGSAILMIAIGWLIRSLIVHFLKKDVELHRAELNHINNLALTELKHVKQITELEHGVRFSRLYEERFKRIEEIGRHLFNFRESVFGALKVDSKTKESRLENANKNIDEFSRYLKSSEIYFPEGFTNRLIEALSQARFDLMDFNFASEARTQDWNADRDQLKRSVDTIIKRVNQIWQEGVSEARKLLTEGEPAGAGQPDNPPVKL